MGAPDCLESDCGVWEEGRCHAGTALAGTPGRGKALGTTGVPKPGTWLMMALWALAGVDSGAMNAAGRFLEAAFRA